MRQTNMVIAFLSAVAGAAALVVTAANGGGVIGFVLGAVLVANALVRYRLARR